ncbi:hypothetical protein [Flavobacterium sp.]|uniref:hypothetical protein n=1 Tax=Flavobacterium sp. TaxID=239 RepID=UPI00260A9AE2|nr:hypothetical protein [Flavobacterium sp.]
MNAPFTAPKVLQFNTTYNLYKDYKTKVVHQTYSGTFLKNVSNEIYLKIDKTEFINTKKLSLKINHGEKAMIVSNSQEFSTGQFDVSKLIEFCKISSFKDFKSYWEIILVPKEFSGLNYSQIVINVSKNYVLQKQIFYYNTGMNFSKDYKNQDLSNPRLEILYSTNNSSVNLSKINTNVYFTINKNNKVSVTAKYKNYEVSDKRNNKLNKN